MLYYSPVSSFAIATQRPFNESLINIDKFGTEAYLGLQPTRLFLYMLYIHSSHGFWGHRELPENVHVDI